ncbi:ankyrin-1-like isoform X2 [Homarus americanus]|uniref:ankyrin-1-like isoform X2 n=1 Tax=Homarus americanus TaxID=6706 RepID=UPI001C44187B|nr:ankyrin-1-like isoform X2 [Homarus americanus]
MTSWTTKLEHFALTGNSQGVQEALAQGAAVNGSSKGLRTPLHHAALHGNLAIVHLLCDHNANIKVRSLIDRGMQPLHLAVRKGHTTVLEELLKRGADPNDADNKGFLAVHMAAVYGHTYILTTLQRAGCDLNSQNRDGSTPLHLAAENNRIEAVEWLVQQGVSAQVKNHNQLTAHDCAIKRQYTDIADFLKLHTAPNMPAGVSQREQRRPTPTSATPAGGHNDQQNLPRRHAQQPTSPPQPQAPELTQDSGKRGQDNDSPHHQVSNQPQSAKTQGIERGKSVDRSRTKSVGSSGETTEKTDHGLLWLLAATDDLQGDGDGSGCFTSVDPAEEEIIEAVSNGNYATVERLLVAGVNPDTRSHMAGEKDLTLLHLASWSGHEKVVSLLLMYHADHKATTHGLSAVHWAAVGGHVGVLDIMWKKGFSIKSKTEDGLTALHLAADHGNLAAVKWLVGKGVYIFIKNKRGQTAKHLAKQAGNKDIVNYLQEKEQELKVGSLKSQEKLGEGSFGEVFLVRGRDSMMVVKRIDLSQMSRKHQEYAHREFQLLKSLNHPYIVAYRGGGFKGKYLHIHMEYCGGGDLSSRLKEQKTKGEAFEERQVHCWLLKLCLALKYIHGRKILHRDLKPQNIFLADTGSVKLGDFGLARVLEDSSRALTCLGSPAYMSPEVIRGEAYDAKADMWSFGCVLYEMATLQSGFPFTKVTIAGEFSQSYKTLVKSLLQQDPTKRPTASHILRTAPFLLNVMEAQLVEREQQVDELTQEVVNLTQEAEELTRQMETMSANPSYPNEKKPK